MPQYTKCKSCGASDAVDLLDAEAKCKYCGTVLYARPFAQFNPLSRYGTSAIGNATRAYLVNGMLLLLACSLLATYFDRGGWFRSDLAITIWTAIIPLLTLVWAFNLHPSRRTPMIFVLAMLMNALPFIVAVAIKFPNKIKSDDLWGISALFASCSLVGLIFGVLANNFRKELSGFASWFKGGKAN
jgi:hypothetical protein